MIKTGIVGALSYTGRELLKIFEKHSQAELVYCTSESSGGKTGTFFPFLRNNIHLQKYQAQNAAASCDLIFLALPPGAAHDYVYELTTLKPELKIIDLSGAYRLISPEDFSFYYGFEHRHISLAEKAVYGLCEIYREKIRKAQLITNPGCYPTAALLPLVPLIRKNLVEPKDIIIDAKSGISGKGKKLHEDSLFCELNENSCSYKTGTHQHTPEIERILADNGLGIKVLFSPSVIPLSRGMLSNSYFRSRAPLEKLIETLASFYKNSPFIKIREAGRYPAILDVAGTNQAHINIFEDERTGFFLAVSAIDNLLKGASGQAVQNMNIMYGINETEGLL